VEPNASARSKGGKSFAATPAETLRQRADRLFADGRWAEAAAAYRELLRNDPDSPDAEHWRQRLAVAVQAEGEAPARATAKAAKAAKRPAAADKQATH
jgi:tetratricopeptide (TPR) repeat protein